MKPLAWPAMALLLSACTPPAMTHSALAPADPKSSSAAQRYVPVTSGTRDFQPVEPKPWGNQPQESEAPEPEAEE